MRKGQRVRAVCGDGVCRSVVITSAEPWAWDAIAASVQVTAHGARFSIAGTLSGVGASEAVNPHPAPSGVQYRFHSNALVSVCGWTPHRPVAPRLRKLAAAFVAPWANRPGFFLYALAEILREEAAARGLCTAEPGTATGAHGPRPWAKPIRAALSRVKPEPLARMARLAWAWRCWRMAEANRASGLPHEGRAWDTARKI